MYSTNGPTPNPTHLAVYWFDNNNGGFIYSETHRELARIGGNSMDNEDMEVQEVEQEDVTSMDALTGILEAVASEEFDMTDTTQMNEVAAGLRDILFQITEGTYRALAARHDEFKEEVKRAKAAKRKRERDLEDKTISKEFKKALSAEVERNEKLIASTPSAWADLKAIEKAARALIRPE